MACLVCLLAACSTPLPYRVAAPLPDVQQRRQARSLEDPALRAVLARAGLTMPSPGADWPAATLALAAGWASPEVAVAEARWHQALAQARATAVAPPGLLDLALAYHSALDGVRPSPWALGFGFEFTLPDAVRRGARLAISDTEVDEARLAVADTGWTVRQATLRACLAVQAARAQRVALVWQQQLAAVLQGLQARRLAVDVASPAEGRDADVALAETQAALDQAQQEEIQAMASLRDRLGLAPEYRVPLALEALPSAPAAGPDSLAALLAAWMGSLRSALVDDLGSPASGGAAPLGRLALDNRLDLRQAEARYRRSDAALRLAVAQQYPEWSLHPGYEWDQGDHLLRLGLALPLALPQAHGAAVALAEAERTQAGEQLLAMQQAILTGVEQAGLALAGARQRQRDCNGLLQRRLTQVERLEMGRHAGQSDALESVQAALALLPLQQQCRDARAQVALAQWSLEQQVQQPIAGEAP